MSAYHDTSILPRRRRHGILGTIHIAFLALLVAFVLLWIRSRLDAHFPFMTTTVRNGGCLVSRGSYQGSIYESHVHGGIEKNIGGETLANQCLVESPWMRLAQHTVRLSPNRDKAIDDWLWIDYHDRINVLVEDPRYSTGKKEEMSFLILQQTKYALDSQMSLAVVGGIIEPGAAPHSYMEGNNNMMNIKSKNGIRVTQEAPLLAGQREVSEELNVSCKKWIALGKFRTDVNRGMGWVYPYLARDCSFSSHGDVDDSISQNEQNEEVIIGGHDVEKQSFHSMTLREVRQAAMAGQFVEVQWSNTVALAMLHLTSES